MKKLFILLSFVMVISILASCSPSNTTTDENIEVDREITIVGYTGSNVEDYRFEPEEIVLKRGETVRFKLESDNAVSHGIQFQGTKLTLSERKTEVYTANQVGEFEGRCNTLCGAGHATMTIKLIVED